VLRPTPTKQPARDQIRETNTQATNQKHKDMKKKEEKRRPTNNNKKRPIKRLRLKVLLRTKM
jgi:hypothetical protein